MKKNILSAVLSLALIMTVPVPAAKAFMSAHKFSVPAVTAENTAENASSTNGKDTRASGKCGKKARWTFKNGALIISGTGEIYNYSSYDYEHGGKRAYRYIFPHEHFNNCRSDRNNIQIRQKKP